MPEYSPATMQAYSDYVPLILIVKASRVQSPNFNRAVARAQQCIDIVRQEHTSQGVALVHKMESDLLWAMTSDLPAGYDYAPVIESKPAPSKPPAQGSYGLTRLGALAGLGGVVMLLAGPDITYRAVGAALAVFAIWLLGLRGFIVWTVVAAFVIGLFLLRK